MLQGKLQKARNMTNYGTEVDVIYNPGVNSVSEGPESYFGGGLHLVVWISDWNV